MMPLLAPSGSSPHQQPFPLLTALAPHSREHRERGWSAPEGPAGSLGNAAGNTAALQCQGGNGSRSGGAAVPHMLQCDGC